MHDDRRGDACGFSGIRLAEDRDSGIGLGEERGQAGVGGHERGGVFALSYGYPYAGSTASLTASEGSVVFVGEDARLELFPTDEYGRAVPFRPKRRDGGGCFDRLADCRERINTDIVCVCILAVVCVVIIIILIIDH